MVHFSAYWCMPSRAMNSFFEELAFTYQDVLFLKVDVDEVKVIYFPINIHISCVKHMVRSRVFPLGLSFDVCEDYFGGIAYLRNFQLICSYAVP